mmetsp:Transcript_15789/g.42234  ORF Transcript_15789/g.42234 Transcript_15789/m.42234 type:complete len:283 (-) Transcript_15789:112-960(-)
MTPSCSRPHRPRLCRHVAWELHVLLRLCMARSSSNTILRTMPKSRMYRTSGMVTEDSAMFVDSTTLQCPGGGGIRACLCCSWGTTEWSMWNASWQFLPRTPTKASWTCSISARPGRKISTQSPGCATACTIPTHTSKSCGFTSTRPPALSKRSILTAGVKPGSAPFARSSRKNGYVGNLLDPTTIASFSAFTPWPPKYSKNCAASTVADMRTSLRPGLLGRLRFSSRHSRSMSRSRSWISSRTMCVYSFSAWGRCASFISSHPVVTKLRRVAPDTWPSMATL